MKFSKDKYREMLLSVTEIETQTDIMTDLLNELGINTSNNKVYKLLIWNDHVNNMVDVIMALYQICKLSPSDAERVMIEAHEKGKAVVKTGSIEELTIMKKGLNDRNLEATIEQ